MEVDRIFRDAFKISGAPYESNKQDLTNLGDIFFCFKSNYPLLDLQIYEFQKIIYEMKISDWQRYSFKLRVFDQLESSIYV